MIYEYRCPVCGHRMTVDLEMADRDQFIGAGCTKSLACPGRLKRVFSFTSPPMLHEHFNQTTGQVVSSHRQFRDQLKRASDEATAKTGIVHSFVPADPREVAATVTDDGMKSTHDRAVASGLKDPVRKVL